MPLIVGHFRVLEFVHENDHTNWPYGDGDYLDPYAWRDIEYEAYNSCHYMSTLRGCIYITFHEWGVAFPNRDTSFKCKYEFKWRVLRDYEIEHVIDMQRRPIVFGDINKGVHSIRLVPIWVRQAKGAQVSVLPLPTDLQRHVFGFL